MILLSPSLRKLMLYPLPMSCVIKGHIICSCSFQECASQEWRTGHHEIIERRQENRSTPHSQEIAQKHFWLAYH